MRNVGSSSCTSAQSPDASVVVTGSHRENLAYVADGAAGLQIIDISDPLNPVIVGAVDTPGEAQDVMVSVSVADLDLDGLPDIVTANSLSGDVSVLFQPEP